MEPKSFVYLLFSISLGSIGQYFFKRGMDGAKVAMSPDVIMYFFKPLVMIGLVCYALATVFWLVILSSERLSVVYPFISLSYIIVVLMGQFVFHEKGSWISWVGLLLICCGVCLVGVGAQASKGTGPQALPPATTAPG